MLGKKISLNYSKGFTAAALVLGFSVAALPAQADVITFNSLTNPGTDFTSAGTSYTEDGFTFTGVAGPFGNELIAWNTDDPNHPANSTDASLTAYFAAMSIALSSGGAFDLQSIDLAQWGANQHGGSTFAVTFNGVKEGGGTVSQTFNVANVAGSPVFGTFSFSGFTDLTQVSVSRAFFRAALLGSLTT